jgi:hypothetical protein
MMIAIGPDDPVRRLMALTIDRHRAAGVVCAALPSSWIMSNICDGEQRRDRHER